MIRDEDRFAHMLEAIHLARESVEGLTKEQFLANPDKKAALQHYIMVDGKSANLSIMLLVKLVCRWRSGRSGWRVAMSVIAQSAFRTHLPGGPTMTFLLLPDRAAILKLLTPGLSLAF